MVQYNIRIHPENPELKKTPFWGSLMHAMFMEHLPEEWQEALHTQDVRPFSQWIEIDAQDGFLWHLCVYSDALFEALQPHLAEGARWHCKHLGCDFVFASVARVITTLQEYMKHVFSGERAPDHLQLTFRTTTSHRVEGQYTLFPSVDLIGRNLRAHIMALDENSVLGSDEVLDDILAHTRIVRYELKSSSYALEGTRVYGYTGWIELSIKGPDALRRLAYMLYGFAEYSGVGIKTALGMGGCTVRIQERSFKR